MEKYKQIYSAMTEKLQKLKTESGKINNEFEEKKEILENNLVEIEFLEKELADLKDDKKWEFEIPLKEKISNIFAYINFTILAITCIAGTAIGAYCLTESISLLKLIMAAVSVISVALVTNGILEYILKKKLVSKIECSEEYKNLLKEIKAKEQKLSKLKELIPEIKIEFENVQAQVNTTNAEIREIEGQIALLKDEVFYSIVDAPVQSEEKARPYTRVKRIEDSI